MTTPTYPLAGIRRIRTTSGRQIAAEVEYWVIGTTDPTVAQATVYALCGSPYENALYQTDTLESAGNGCWTCRVQYQAELAQWAFNFRTTGAKQKITHSLATIGSYAASGYSAPNFGQAIGVTADSVEGTDVIIPSFSWDDERNFTIADATSTSYLATLANATGTVNSSTFRGQAAGTVLFMGAEGRACSTAQYATIKFQFAVSPDASSLQIGDISGISKPGWSYLWVRDMDVMDPSAMFMIKKPIAAYVERIYQQSNFGSLGIGT